MQEKTTHAVNPGEDKFLLLNGLRFHYVAWGDASLPPLVCLHGLRSYGQTYGPLATTLMDRFHVIGLDQRGRGQTAWDPEQGYYTDRYVADLECLVDQLGFDKFHVLGHSMGGTNSLVYAKKHPDRLASIILEDAGPGAWNQSRGASRINIELQNTPITFDSWAKARAFWRSIRPNVTEDAIDSRVTNSLIETAAGITWKHDQAGITACRLQPDPLREPPDLWPCVEAIACPTLVLRGEASDYLSRTTYTEMLQRNKLLQGVEIDGAGHYVHDDQPTQFIGAVNTYLNARIA